MVYINIYSGLYLLSCDQLRLAKRLQYWLCCTVCKIVYWGKKKSVKLQPNMLYRKNKNYIITLPLLTNMVLSILLNS